MQRHKIRKPTSSVRSLPKKSTTIRKHKLNKNTLHSISHPSFATKTTTDEKPKTTRKPRTTTTTKKAAAAEPIPGPSAAIAAASSYFTQYARLDGPATVDLDSIGSSTTGLEFKPNEQTSAFNKSVKLGKHRAKIPIENAPTISKSLYRSLETGNLPTLIQQEQQKDFYAEMYDTQINTNDNNNNINSLDSISATGPLELEPDNDFMAAYNALISTDLSDLNIRTPKGDDKTTQKKTKDTSKKKDHASKFGKQHDPFKIDDNADDDIATKLGPTATDISAAATAANWFPGHMKKALDDMAEKIKHVPITIEVRDARLPLSSANPLLDQLTTNKTKIIVLNKTDLVKDATKSMLKLASTMGLPTTRLRLDKTLHPIVMKSKPKTKEGQTMFEKQELSKQHNSEVDVWLNQLLTLYPDLSSLPSSLVSAPHIISPDRRLAIVLTHKDSLETTKALLSLVKALSPKKKFGSLPTSAIICGFPNVGKSTLINNLKTSARMTLGKDGLEQGQWSLGTTQNLVSKARAKIGPLPGVTRQVQGFKVSQVPPIVILDSPGIMVPRFDRSQAGIHTSYKLALVQCISEVVADPRTQCEHMLKILNEQPEKHYLNYYNIPLQTPIHDLALLMPFIARKEEVQPQSITQWRESVQKARFGRPLKESEYKSVIYKSRMKEKEANINLGALLNEYEKKKKTTVKMTEWDFSQYLFPSKEEIHYEMSPEMEDLCMRVMLKAFRTGKLGKFMMD